MKTKSLGFIGGGRITKIFLQAFQNKSVKFDSVVVFDTNNQILDSLKKQFPKIEIVNSSGLPAKQDMVMLAVHPPAMMETLNGIKDSLATESIVLSLAPKINIDKMNSVLQTDKIVRMIPNATSFINEGYNPVAFHGSFSEEAKNDFINTFNVLGKTFEVEESKLEGYAIVSAMLPTYFWFQWNKMEDIAIRTGLTKDEAIETIHTTLKCATQLFFAAGYSSEEVMDLIPVKPIGENEEEINSILETKLIRLFDKIKPN